MNSELELMIENFLSENAKSLKDLGTILDNVNKSYYKYSNYVDALKDGIITYIDFANGHKLENSEGKLTFDGQTIKGISVIRGGEKSPEESEVVVEEDSKGNHIINFEMDKISDAGNPDVLSKITSERNILDWLVIKAYDPKFAGQRSLFDMYVKQNKNAEEFLVPFVNNVNSYSLYRNGVKLFYYNPKTSSDEPLKDEKGKQKTLKLGTEYTTKDNKVIKNANNILALSIDDLFTLISAFKKDEADMIKAEESKFKVEASEEGEVEGKVGGESSLRKHFDSLIAKHPYHNKGDDLNYVLPGIITQYGNWTLIEYTTDKDALFWSNPSQDWQDNTINYPKCSYKGKWASPESAKKKIESYTKEQLQNWFGTTIAPFSETYGATWCTAQSGSTYVSRGSVYMIMKDFKKYIQYMPTESQFEFWNDNTHASSPTDEIKEIMDNVPPFIEHCIEGGKDNMVPDDRLFTYYQKNKILPSINSYMRLHKGKFITSEQLINDLSDPAVEKQLYQIREKNRKAIDPWSSLSKETLDSLLSAFKVEFKKGDDATILKIVKIVSHIINGSSNFFIKVKFNKTNSASKFLYDIIDYMMENHPSDKSTKLLFEKFSTVDKVDLKKIVNLTNNEEAIFQTASDLCNAQFSGFSNAEINDFYYAGVMVKNIKDLSTIANGKESSEDTNNITLIKDLTAFFSNNGVSLKADSSVTELSDSITKKEGNKESLSQIINNSKTYYDSLKKIISGILAKEGKNISVKNHRNLLLDSIISSKVDVLKNKDVLSYVEEQLKNLKVTINPTDIYIPIMDIDYFDNSEDKDLRGLSLLTSILNSKHELVDMSSVNNSNFSITTTLQGEGVISPAENGKYYLSSKQYNYLLKKISAYLKNDIFKSKTLKVDDSYFTEVKQKGLKLENISPLELIISKMQDKTISSEYRDSLLEIFNESMNKKTITDLGSIISNFYKDVGDYLYPKINLTSIYNEFVSEFKSK